MNGTWQMRARARLWRALEALRDSALARRLLGCADLLRSLFWSVLGHPYRALDAASRIHRLLRVPALEWLASGIEAPLLRATCLAPDGGPRRSADNALVDDFRLGRPCAALFRGGLDHWEKLVRMGGELLLLKEPDPATGELGVLILKYTSGFGRFVALYDLPRVLQDFQIVLEPSWIGYQDPMFQLFYARERRIVVQANDPRDHAWIREGRSNLVPVPFAAGHWVSREHFHPLPAVAKDYLAVFVANWAPHKRHHLALEALARIDDPSARLALVGYPWKGYTRARVEEEVRRRGLADRVDVYERISRKDVNLVFNRSHTNLILSRKEGSPKVFYEGLAAGTPCLVVEDHESVRPDEVNDRTGLRVPARQLADGMLYLRDQGPTLDPHGYWDEFLSLEASSRVLEDTLREAARADGRPWTRGIERKKNDPNLAYLDPQAEVRMRSAYAALGRYLRADSELRRYRVRYERPADLG